MDNEGTRPDEPLWSGASNLGRLEQRVINTEDRLGEIRAELRDLNSSIKELNTAIADISKPRYQTWAAIGSLVVTVTVGVWWLAITPINERIRAIEVTNAVIVPREVHIEKWAMFDREILHLENEIELRATKDDLNRLIIEIDRRLAKK